MTDDDRQAAAATPPEQELPATEAHGSGPASGGVSAPPASTAPAPPSRAPKWIGPYEVVDVLGAGGMGTVYLARQREPLERLVAVKLIRDEVLDERRALRFDTERRTLARMSHPNIAQVFAAGTTPGGEPYIAMEHVPGEWITAYCDKRRLAIPERVRLLAEVCRGVQHLHQKSVLHRDLKPSNILVMEEQGRPLPKIIDFGIAKAIDRPRRDGEGITQQHVVGTPGYIAPEMLLAAEGEGDQDTRSDVYSLGLVLFALLVGELPFRRDGRSMVETLRRITEEDPPTLRERWRQIDAADRETIAADRATTPAALERRLAHDLEWIVAKAIARQRDDRYASAAELASDLERHLAHEPVVAGPPRALYRLRKLVRRHRAAAAAALLVTLALVAGLAARTVEARRANREAARASAEAARANREAAAAHEVSDFLTELFKVSDPSEARGNSITAREILDRGAERIRGGLAGQPLTQARLMNTMGSVYSSLGLHDAARPLVEEGLALRRRLLPADDPELIESIARLSVVATEQGKFGEAEALTREALAASVRRFGAGSAEASQRTTRLAVLLHNRGRLDESIEVQKRALAIADALGPPDESYLTGLNNLGSLYLDSGRLKEAEPVIRRTLALREKLLGPEDPLVAQSLSNLALLMMNTERVAEAKPLIERAVAIREKVLGPEHPNLVWSLRLLGEVYRAQKSYDRALAIFERCLRIQEKALGPDHPFTALTLEALGNLHRDRGDLARARAYLERCVRIAEPALGAEHPDLAYYLASLANVYRDERRLAAAEPLYRRALAIFAKQNAHSPDAVKVRAELEKLLREDGRSAVGASLVPANVVARRVSASTAALAGRRRRG
jgi:eukaryotic-like serine/threonine-protein kinase